MWNSTHSLSLLPRGLTKKQGYWGGGGWKGYRIRWSMQFQCQIRRCSHRGIRCSATIMLWIHNPHNFFAQIQIHHIYWIRKSAEIIVEIRNPNKIFGQNHRSSDPFTLPLLEGRLGESFGCWTKSLHRYWHQRSRPPALEWTKTGSIKLRSLSFSKQSQL